MAEVEVTKDEVSGTGSDEAATAKVVETDSGSSGIHESENPPDSGAEVNGIPSELLQKHQLQSEWVLWYLKVDRNKNWTQCLQKVAEFSTVEDFWALYNHIQVASGLNWGSDYYVFKKGIEPKWEDTQNIIGGRWLIMVDKQRRNEILDHYWLEMLMAMLGEQFEDCGEQVCGAVANIRQKGDKVSLWTRDADNTMINTRIGHILKAKLVVPDSEPMRYEAHKDTSMKTGSTVKPLILLPPKDPPAPKDR